MFSLSLAFKFWSHPLAWLCGLQGCSLLCIFSPPSTSVVQAWLFQFQNCLSHVGLPTIFPFLASSLAEQR